jgi:hypothetical protein
VLKAFVNWRNKKPQHPFLDGGHRSIWDSLGCGREEEQMKSTNPQKRKVNVASCNPVIHGLDICSMGH